MRMAENWEAVETCLLAQTVEIVTWICAHEHVRNTGLGAVLL